MSKQTFSSGVMVNGRRRSALKMLTTQLESGMKTEKGVMPNPIKIPLTEKDKARINREISTLKTRI